MRFTYCILPTRTALGKPRAVFFTSKRSWYRAGFELIRIRSGFSFVLRNFDKKKNTTYALSMSKLDEVKEILNTLRVTMSLSFGMLMIVVSGIINRFDQNRVDMVFWLGFLFAVFLLVIIFLLIIKISQKTKEIKEM